MSFFLDTLRKTLEKITGNCKDRHSYLKACCNYAMTRIKDPDVEQIPPEELSNIFFYPLKIAAETREESFVLLSLDVILKMVAQGIVDASQLYKSPDIAAPVKKKTFSQFFSNDEAAPTVTPKNEREENLPLVTVIINTVCLNSTMQLDEVQMNVARTLLTIVCMQKCEIHGAQLLLAIRTCCNIYLQGRTPQVQTSAKTSLSHIIGTVQMRTETESTETFTHTASEDANADSDVTDKLDEGNHQFSGVNERDCFLIMRSLCKLTQKCATDSAVDSVEMRSKSLSLTLLYNFMITVGEKFKQSNAFCQGLHKYLCGSLLQNCMSTVGDISKVSMSILLTLFVAHRALVKSKITVFFIRVLFPLLDSPNASFSHKSSVLSLFEKFVLEPQAVADLFVNFDCAVGSPNIYEQFVHKVSKVVQTNHIVPNWVSPQQSDQLKLQGVNILSILAKSLVSWMTSQSVTSPRKEIEDTEEEPLDETNNDVNRMIKDKRVYEAVINTFNKKKPKDGIDLALQSGILKDESVQEVASFLLTKGLDKVKIGEYLAANKPFIKEVQRAFINFNDFTGLMIDEAMRVFLGKFKIYGEAEVVDRTMEQFAERYCLQNQGAFSSPGTAYILSFSIMMLNTDLHSVHVKAKMTVDEFIRNNRGIDDEKDLPRPFLEAIFHRIRNREIKLDGDTSVAPKPSVGGDKDDEIFVSLEKKKQMNYKIETDSLVQNSMRMLTDDAPTEEYHVASSQALVAAMWDATWTAMMPAFSVQMEESNSEATIDACLEGFDSGMKINCFFHLTTEKKAFLSSLLAFTHLTNFREIMYKNVKSIDTLIRIAGREGCFLESSWHEILRCISLLDKLHLIGNSSRIDSSATDTTPRRNSVTQRAADHKRMEQHNAEMIGCHVNLVEVERIFSRSGDLSGSAVVDLVEALCKVSAEELQEQPQPRTFSLQKLVEVAEINIGRLRYFWAKIWAHMSKHFISVGLDKQPIVSMFVVDSLRQLAMKFLQRDELGNFNFQRDFLKPFEVIASQTKRGEIRELIIASLGQMVDARANNIMSGWKTLINSLAKCSGDTSHSVVSAAFEVLRRVTLRHLFLIATPELITEAVNAWSMFGGNMVDRNLARGAVSYVQLLAVAVANGVPPQQHAIYSMDDQDFNAFLGAISATKSSGNISVSLTVGGKLDVKIWLTVFAAMSSLTSAPDFEIRSLAVDALFATISEHGKLFQDEDWQMIMGGTVFPIFDNILCDLHLLTTAESSDREADFAWQVQLLGKAMKGASSVFVEHFPVLNSQLEEMTNAFLQCGRKNSPKISKLGFQNLSQLISALDAQSYLSPKHWDALQNRLVIAAEYCTQKICLLFHRPAVALSPDSDSEHAVAALTQLLDMAAQFMPLASLPTQSVAAFMSVFMNAFSVAAGVLRDHTEENPLKDNIVGDLFDLEKSASAGFIAAIPRAPQDGKVEAWSLDVMQRCAKASNNNAGYHEGAVLQASVIQLLEILEVLPAPRFLAFVDATYDGLCDLITVCSKDISRILARVFFRLKTNQLKTKEETFVAEAPKRSPQVAAENTKIEAKAEANGLANKVEADEGTQQAVNGKSEDAPEVEPVSQVENLSNLSDEVAKAVNEPRRRKGKGKQ